MRKVIAQSTEKAPSAWNYIIKAAEDGYYGTKQDQDETIADIFEVINSFAKVFEKEKPKRFTRLITFRTDNIEIIFELKRLLTNPEEGLLEPSGFLLSFKVVPKEQNSSNLAKIHILPENNNVLSTKTLQLLSELEILKLFETSFPDFGNCFLTDILKIQNTQKIATQVTTK